MPDVAVTLEPGESFVVADLIVWEGLVSAFREFAKDYPENSEERNTWLEIARKVELQSVQNYVEEWDDWLEEDDD